MAEDGAQTTDEWTALLELSPEERTTRLIERYSALADANAAERHETIAAQVRSVYSLPAEDLRRFTESRLRAWLAMDPTKAAIVGTEFETTLNAMPAQIAMRRVEVVQSVARGLSTEEQNRLRQIVPGVMGDEPVAIGQTSAPAPARKSSPRWAFWRR